jgi:hypothetical protein
MLVRLHDLDAARTPYGTCRLKYPDRLISRIAGFHDLFFQLTVQAVGAQNEAAFQQAPFPAIFDNGSSSSGKSAILGFPLGQRDRQCGELVLLRQKRLRGMAESRGVF